MLIGETSLLIRINFLLCDRDLEVKREGMLFICVHALVPMSAVHMCESIFIFVCSTTQGIRRMGHEDKNRHGRSGYYMKCDVNVLQIIADWVDAFRLTIVHIRL